MIGILSKATFCLVLCSTIYSFHNIMKTNINTKCKNEIFKRNALSYESEAERLPGALPPMNFFDPFRLSKDRSFAQVKKFREAELKHGRLAMLAVVGFLVQEVFHPLFGFGNEYIGPSIRHFQLVSSRFPNFWVIVMFAIGLVEARTISRGWENYDLTRKRSDGVAMLKDDYIPGDVGFDPLNLMPTTEREFELRRTKELQNGRLAMLAIAGIIAQESVDGKGIFEHLGWA